MSHFQANIDIFSDIFCKNQTYLREKAKLFFSLKLYFLKLSDIKKICLEPKSRKRTKKLLGLCLIKNKKHTYTQIMFNKNVSFTSNTYLKTSVCVRDEVSRCRTFLPRVEQMDSRCEVAPGI